MNSLRLGGFPTPDLHLQDTKGVDGPQKILMADLYEPGEERYEAGLVIRFLGAEAWFFLNFIVI